MMTTATIDALLRTAPDQTENRNRSIVYRWLASEQDDGAKHYVALTAMSYHPERKCFAAGLNSEKHEPASYGGTMIGFALFGGVRVLVSGYVARFSQKALEAFADEARTALSSMDEDEKVQKIIEAARAGRLTL